MADPEVLDRRTLTLATSQRQLLLQRQRTSAVDAITHLVALQAQEPLEPYVGLWSRLSDFEPGALVDLLQRRHAVRTVLMRRTLHLVTATDCLALRPLHQAMLASRSMGALRNVLGDVDPAELAALAEPLFAAEPLTTGDVARQIGSRWPQTRARALADLLSGTVPLVQVPPRGLWGQSAPARCTTIAAWLGRPVADEGSPAVLEELVLRYLRAYGPASSSDLRAWSGLPGLPAVIARVRPRLRSYRDENGRELLDADDAVLPERDVDPPPRFLPAFDNAVLGYDDRRRIIDDDHRNLSVAGARFVLVDGRVAGTWTSGSAVRGEPVLVHVRLLRPHDSSAENRVVDEAQRLAMFLGDGIPGRVIIEQD